MTNSKELSVSTYNIQSWVEKYPNSVVDIMKLIKTDSWDDFFKRKDIVLCIKKINQFLSECLTKNITNMFPYPDLLFNNIELTPIDNIKVVILGQDPYFNIQTIKDKQIPQAMGLSFSVPIGMQIPPSLNNIFLNQIKFKQITKHPLSGNLTYWAEQGCLMLNTTLTVKEKMPNGHELKWKMFTDELIKYISTKTNNIVFMIWGVPSLKKLNLIDSAKHKILVSSHPSPLAARQKLREYNSFMNTDHFGEANKYLIEHDKKAIDWQIA